MKTVKSVFLMIVGLLSLGLMPPAWANQYAAGYKTFLDTGCTLAAGGDICSTGAFNLPSTTRITENTILGFILDCADEGNGVDFEVDVRVNGITVWGSTLGTAIKRGVWEVLGGNVLVLNNNIIDFVAGSPATGSCTVSDVVLQYRMTTVP